MSGASVSVVTAHAMLRYLTRVEDIDLRPYVARVGRDVGNWMLLEAVTEGLGIPVAEVARRVLPPHLAGAVAQGAARIRCGTHVAICSGGKVITILERKAPGHLKVLTKREIKVKAQRLHRRVR